MNSTSNYFIVFIYKPYLKIIYGGPSLIEELTFKICMRKNKNVSVTIVKLTVQ